MTYSKEIIFDIQSLLETICPLKVLIVGESLYGIADEYSAQCASIHRDISVTKVDKATEIANNVYSDRYDFAVIGEVTESTSKQHSQQVLSRVRNFCAPQMIIAVNLNNSEWSMHDFLAIGLAKFTEHKSDGENSILYQYNIDTYKKTPDWFNSENWANPEMWGKHWW